MMAVKTVPVSVIIPTLNRPQALVRTVKVLIGMDIVPEELVVVDQTADETVREEMRTFLKTVTAATVRYVYQERPSITAARNRGIQEASRDILLFMDDDVDVNPDTIENVYRYMQDEQVVMVGATDETLPASTGKVGYLFGLKSWKNRKIGHVTPSMLGRYPDNIKGTVPTMWAMGFCFSLKKSKLQQWGLAFDEKLTGYAYAEDLDLTYAYYKKAAAEGLRCLLAEDLKVKHLESKEFRIPSAKNTFKYVINREYLSYKHGLSFWARISSRWSNFGQFLLRLMQGSGAGDIVRAQIRCDRLRKQLREGILEDHFFEP